MIRDLTSDEVRLVDSRSKPDGSRPYVYDSSTLEYSEINRDVEVFLILAPLEWKNRLSNFLLALSDNDVTNLEARNELRDLWYRDEITDIGENLEGYTEIFSQYDSIRAGFNEASIGFESVEELSQLSKVTNSGLSTLVESRDSVSFAKAAITTLQTRSNSSSTRTDIRLELESWSQALLAYS